MYKYIQNKLILTLIVIILNYLKKAFSMTNNKKLTCMLTGAILLGGSSRVGWVEAIAETHHKHPMWLMCFIISSS